jgi:hypothetical protein
LSPAISTVSTISPTGEFDTANVRNPARYYYYDYDYHDRSLLYCTSGNNMAALCISTSLFLTPHEVVITTTRTSGALNQQNAGTSPAASRVSYTS